MSASATQGVYVLSVHLSVGKVRSINCTLQELHLMFLCVIYRLYVVF